MLTAMKRNLSATEAAKLVAQSLGLDDVKRVGSALATAAAEEAEHNPSFAARVRALYNATVPIAAPRKKSPTTNALWSEVKPIKHIEGFELNPAAPLNPYLVYEACGDKQFARILEAFPLAKLKESAAIVEERNPGTKPVNRGSKSAVMDYIIHYVN